MCFAILILKAIGTPPPSPLLCQTSETIPWNLKFWISLWQGQEMIQNQIIQDKSICWGSVLKIIESDIQSTSWKLCFLSAVQAFEALGFELKICLFIPLADVICICRLLCFVSVFASCLVFVSLGQLGVEHSHIIVWPLPHIGEKRKNLGEKKKSHERRFVAPLSLLACVFKLIFFK